MMVGTRTFWAVCCGALGMALGCGSEFEGADRARDAAADTSSNDGRAGPSVGGSAGAGTGGAAAAAGTGGGTATGGSGGTGGTGGNAGAGGSGGSSGDAGASACAVLSDDFNLPGEPDPLLWKVVTFNGTINQANGLLSIVPAGAGYPAKPHVQSFAKVDLRECTVEVEVTSVAAGTEAQRTQFGVDWYGVSPWFAFTVQNGMLYPKNGSPTTYDPAMHKRWRIRSSNGTSHLETSAGNGTWKLHGSAATPPEFAQAGIWLGAQCDTVPVSAVSEASFDYAHAY